MKTQHVGTGIFKFMKDTKNCRKTLPHFVQKSVFYSRIKWITGVISFAHCPRFVIFK